MEHKGADNYTGSNYRFSISNIEITENFENTGATSVQFTLTTSRGSAEFLEWLDVVNSESVDSHIKTNQINEFHGLFYDKIEVSTALEAVREEMSNQLEVIIDDFGKTISFNSEWPEYCHIAHLDNGLFQAVVENESLGDYEYIEKAAEEIETWLKQNQ